MHKAHVRVSPRNMPEHIDVDITNLKLATAIHIGDLNVEQARRECVRMLEEGIATAQDIDTRSYTGEGANLAMMAASVDHILHTAKDRGLDVSQLAALKGVTDRNAAGSFFADAYEDVDAYVQSSSTVELAG